MKIEILRLSGTRKLSQIFYEIYSINDKKG
jgi:hypothetical protein